MTIEYKLIIERHIKDYQNIDIVDTVSWINTLCAKSNGLMRCKEHFTEEKDGIYLYFVLEGSIEREETYLTGSDKWYIALEELNKTLIFNVGTIRSLAIK